MSTQTKQNSCFNQISDITPNGRSLKLVDKITYFGNSIFENDINRQLAKAWTAIDRLPAIWKSDISNKVKRSFSKQRSSPYCYMDAPHGGWLSIWRKNLTAIARDCYKLYWTSPGGAIPQSCSCTDTFLPSRKPFKLDEQDIRDTAGEVRASS